MKCTVQVRLPPYKVDHFKEVLKEAGGTIVKEVHRLHVRGSRRNGMPKTTGWVTITYRPAVTLR